MPSFLVQEQVPCVGSVEHHGQHSQFVMAAVSIALAPPAEASDAELQFPFDVLWPHAAATRSQRIVAVIIWLLSRSCDLALVFLQTRPGGAPRIADLPPAGAPFALCLFEWFVSLEADVEQVVENLQHPLRQRADEFLLRSLVAQFVLYQNRKGLVVPLDAAIRTYLRLWSLRPVAETVKVHLVRLTHHRNARRKFGQLLRREWMLQNGIMPEGRDLDEHEIRDRAPCGGNPSTWPGRFDTLQLRVRRAARCEAHESRDLRSGAHRNLSDLAWGSPPTWTGAGLPEVGALLGGQGVPAAPVRHRQHGRNVADRSAGL